MSSVPGGSDPPPEDESSENFRSSEERSLCRRRAVGERTILAGRLRLRAGASVCQEVVVAKEMKYLSLGEKILMKT